MAGLDEMARDDRAGLAGGADQRDAQGPLI
jgi:hypothetical protein